MAHDLIPSTSARFIHDPFRPWRRPAREAVQGRNAIWHTLWSETYSNPRYAELVQRLDQLFFAPIRQRPGLLGRLDGGVARRSRFIERQTLEWYRRGGLHVLLTPSPEQASLFSGSVVVDLDDPSLAPEEQASLAAENIRHVIVTTSAMAGYVRTANPAVDVTVVPQGVSLENAAGARYEEVRAEILSRAGLPAETVIVGYHAPLICLSSDREFDVEKSRTFYVDVLMSAVHRLWSEGHSFVTVLVGTPSSTIEAFARAESRLVLVGYVDRDRLFDWVGAFDVGVYPRTVDFGGRQSVKLLEYMANGAAIVAMRTSETRFLDVTATGYTAGTPDEFVGLLGRLVASGDERLSLIDRAHALVDDHDWRKLAKRYDQVLVGVAEDQ